ncbi:MAG: hypothetical protein HC799_05505 [Limnothrix sp. RL_2_0]|nr:hypothetical protein [Limnothrix sp. RL_2_0]
MNWAMGRVFASGKVGDSCGAIATGLVMVRWDESSTTLNLPKEGSLGYANLTATDFGFVSLFGQ